MLRLIDNRFSAIDCQLSMAIEIAPTQRMAKQRIKAMRLWLESFVDDCIALAAGTDTDTTTIEQVTNNVMLCPDEPHDYLLLLLLHSKLNAIGAGEVIITKSTLITDGGEGFANSFSGPTDDWLPSIKEWIGPRTFHELPWWERADTSTLDMKPEEGDDLSSIPDLGDDILRMVADPPNEPAPSQPAEIIRPKFKPRLVTSDE